MIHQIVAAAMLLAVLAGDRAQAAVPLNFTLENINGADGYIVQDGEAGFTIFGGDDGVLDASFSAFTLVSGVADMDFTLSGDWRYQSFDADGPLVDPAGYFINDSLTPLSRSALGAVQSGQFSFMLMSGDRFGFYVETLDGMFGRGSLGISGLSRPFSFGGGDGGGDGGMVPEPASWMMLIAGFGAVGVVLRRRRTGGAPLRGHGGALPA
jgi:hypothetical protein